MNVALYGDGASRWTMTERGREAIRREPTFLRVGPTSVRWDEDSLLLDIDELTAPLPRRVKGTIRVTPESLPGRTFALDAHGRHLWHPIAPRARIEVALSRPGLSWSGTAYLDSNSGAEPIEDGFTSWTWSRAHPRHGSVVLYDACRRDGMQTALALRFAADGGVTELPPPPRAALPKTRWRLDRTTRADAGYQPRLIGSLEDTPFYARALLETRIDGEAVQALHENLSLDRFRSNIVRTMLAFRMPRRIL